VVFLHVPAESSKSLSRSYVSSLCREASSLSTRKSSNSLVQTLSHSVLLKQVIFHNPTSGMLILRFSCVDEYAVRTGVEITIELIRAWVDSNRSKKVDRAADVMTESK
jgi:hypothetical protein